MTRDQKFRKRSSSPSKAVDGNLSLAKKKEEERKKHTIALLCQWTYFFWNLQPIIVLLRSIPTLPFYGALISIFFRDCLYVVLRVLHF